MLAPGPGQAASILRVATAGRLAPDGLLRFDQAGEDGCGRFRLVGQAVRGDGRTVEAAAVVAEWEAALRRDGDPALWLLAPVQGVDEFVRGETLHPSGLGVDPEERLRICTETRTPDWPARMSHPALWLRGPDRSGAGSNGPGPFRFTEAAGVLAASPRDADGRPLLDGIEILGPAASDSASLFDLGAADVAIVSGRDATPLVADPEARLRVERLRSWDSVYALWFGSRARWVSDPRFRAWVAAAVDREAMLRFLFDGRGEPAYRLTAEGSAEWRLPPTRPFSRGSVPRLALIFDSADADATSIASRLKATLEQAGLSIVLEPETGDRLREALNEDGFQMALVVHRPPVADPVLALQHTLWSLGNPVPETWDSLVRAGWWDDDDRRLSAALFAEDALLRQARLVPLVRVYAWLVTRRGLEEVVAGPWGVLRLEHARWVR